MNTSHIVTLAAAAAGVACGGPTPARKTIPAADTGAAFGSAARVDTTGLANRRASVTQQQVDSQNTAIRAKLSGAVLPKPKRIERKAP